MDRMPGGGQPRPFAESEMATKSFRDWLSERGRNQPIEKARSAYINSILFKSRSYPPFYPRVQAKQDFDEAFATMLDEFAETLDKRLSKRSEVPQPSDGKKGSGTDSGKNQDQSDKDQSTSKSGGGAKPFTTSNPQEKDGNTIVAKKDKPAPYNNKVEYGNQALRTVFVRMPKNPDLVMKTDTEREISSDATLWGIVRPSRVMNISKENLKEFEEADPGTPWLGFLRIGRRVGLEEDRIALIQIVQSISPGQKFVVPVKELIAGDPWHQYWLNRKFAAKAEPKIKTWNGWNLDALKKEKTLRLTDTGSFYGFFMVKAIDSDPNHYINFRCASLNQYANAVFSDVVPDVPTAKMSREQLMAFRNLTEAARGGFSPRMKEIEQHFPDIKLRRAALEVETASKKLPLSWAKAVVDTINKF